MNAANRTTMDSMRALAAAAMLLGGTASLGLTPSPVQAQVKSVADVKTMIKAELPPGAMEITDAMKSANVGQTITVRGYVAMAKDAFDKGVATFTLVDEAARKGDRPAPNALPDTSDAIPSASRATIRIVDASGKPLSDSLKGKHGLAPGVEVFVTGTVDAANGSDSLVLTATSMHIPRAPLPVGFFKDTLPEDAKDVSQARKAATLKVGDDVVLQGRIGGSKEPFVAGRAVFTLMGRGLKPCNENPDDRCSMPWDYCCESRDDIVANSVTVQVVDAKGRILRTDMKGRRALKELSEIVVTGKVASASAGVVIVNATSIHEVR